MLRFVTGMVDWEMNYRDGGLGNELQGWWIGKWMTGMVDWEMNFSKIYLGSLMKSQLTGVKPVQVITYSVSEFF